MVCGPKARKVCSRNNECNGFYAPSYSTTKAYPTLETKAIGIKICLNSLFLFLKDFLRCKIIAIDGAKSRADSSKEAHFNQRKFGRRQLYRFSG
jgi:hypothetical protein